MNRYKHLLAQPQFKLDSKIIGIFPFDTLINSKDSDVHTGNLSFIESAIDGLKLLASKQYSVVMFVNQNKLRPLSNESFQAMTNAIENFVKQYGVDVKGVYWCPGVSKDDPFVVPNAGMFHRVTEHHNINWKDISVVSTSNNDLKAADKVAASGIKIGNEPSKWPHYLSFFDYVNTLN